MASTFAWIDNSSEDRRRVLDAIESLKETDARDELGLGSIRDGFSNALFPGTGTAQSRAAYFLFVPWTYLRLKVRKVRADTIEDQARKLEVKLIKELLNSKDTDGVIGKVSQERLKRLPSSIYWNGLRAWGIFERPMNVDEYHRQFNEFCEYEEDRDEDHQLIDGAGRRDWSATIPPPPAEFPTGASFKLSAAERRWLIDRVILTNGQSLLAWLLRHATTVEGDAPWEHPQAPSFPPAIARLVDHARFFSEAMAGAPFLYNLMLAEQLKVEEQRKTLSARYRQSLIEWRERLAPRRSVLSAWSLQSFWELVRPLANVHAGARGFVEDWIRLRGWETSDGLADSTVARALIERRERQLKGPRARLGNERALELWGGESGTGRLTYRWSNVVQLLTDLRPELAPTHAES